MSVKLNLLHIFSRRRSRILGGKVLFYSFISPLKVSLMYPPCYRCLKSGSKPRHYHQQSPCPGAERAAAALRRPGAEPRGESGMWHFRCSGDRHSSTRRPGAGIPRLEIYPQYSENLDTMLNGQLNMVSPSVLGHLSANLIIDDVQLYFKDLS